VYENIRKKFLHQKYLEASVLEKLITKNKKNIIKLENLKQTNTNMTNKTFEEYKDIFKNNYIEDDKATISEIFVQSFNSNVINEKCVNINEDNHVEPQCLNKSISEKMKNTSLEKYIVTNSSNLTGNTHENCIIKNENNYILNKSNSEEIKNIKLEKHNSLNEKYEIFVNKDNDIETNDLDKHVSGKINDVIKFETLISTNNSNSINKCVNIQENDHIEPTILCKHSFENEKNIQSETFVQSKNLNLINKTCINRNESDHIEPNILSMLKDVYVDFEYLPALCDDKKYGNIFNCKFYFKKLTIIKWISDDKSPILQENKKINVQTSRKKLVENKCFTKSKENTLKFFIY